MTTEQALQDDKTANAEPQQHQASMVSLAIYLLAFFAIWSLRATVFYRIDASIESPSWRNVYSNIVKFVIWVVPVFVTLILVDKIRPLVYLKLSTVIDSRGALMPALVMLIFLSGVVLVEASRQGKSAWVLLGQPSLRWLAILASVFSSPIWEEILFRGFILNRLNERLGFWKSNVISALLFMLAHVPYWVTHDGVSQRVITDLLNVFVLGCLFGWFMKKSNSLWPPIGTHIANNFLSALIHG